MPAGAAATPRSASLIAASVLLSAVASGFAAVSWQALEGTRVALSDLKRANRLESAQRQIADGERESAQAHLYLAHVQMAWQAYQSADLPGMESYLAASRPEPGQGDRRCWEWYYLLGLTRQERRNLAGHQGAVRALAFSPDGRRVASSGDDRSVQYRDSTTGSLLHGLEGHTEIVQALAWTPDGTRIASAGRDDAIRVWDSASGHLLHCVPTLPGGVRALGWDSGGRRLAAAVGLDVLILDPAAAQSLATLRGHTEFVAAASFSPDGARLASGGDDRSVRLWDPLTARPVHRLAGHTGWVNAVAWAPAGDRSPPQGRMGRSGSGKARPDDRSPSAQGSKVPDSWPFPGAPTVPS